MANLNVKVFFLRFILSAFLAAAMACEKGTEPLDPRNLAGEYELVLVEGYSLPIDVWHSGRLTLRADSTYTMIVNDLPYDHGTWTVIGQQFVVTSRYEPVWTGLLQPRGILFKPDVFHYNNLLFEQGP
jgi:hypothetical protein